GRGWSGAGGSAPRGPGDGAPVLAGRVVRRDARRRAPPGRAIRGKGDVRARPAPARSAFRGSLRLLRCGSVFGAALELGAGTLRCRDAVYPTGASASGAGSPTASPPAPDC